MTQSALQSITNNYQHQIKLHEFGMHQTLTTAHEQAVRQIQPHLTQLYREIEQKQHAEEEATLSWLYQGQRMRLLKQVVQQHINAFGSFAHVMSDQAQRQGVTLGSQSGLAQVRGVSNGQLITTPSHDALTALSEHQDSARSHLFSGYGAEAAQEVARSLITGVSLKQPVKQIASGVIGKLKHSLHRAIVTVGETFMGAYRDVVSLFYRANSEIIQQWVWTAEAGCCPICADLNGSVHSIDEDFEGAHPRCRCEAVPIPFSEILSLNETRSKTGLEDEGDL